MTPSKGFLVSTLTVIESPAQEAFTLGRNSSPYIFSIAPKTFPRPWIMNESTNRMMSSNYTWRAMIRNTRDDIFTLVLKIFGLNRINYHHFPASGVPSSNVGVMTLTHSNRQHLGWHSSTLTDGHPRLVPPAMDEKMVMCQWWGLLMENWTKPVSLLSC